MLAKKLAPIPINKFDTHGYTLKRNYYCKSDDLCIVNEVEFLLFDKYFIWGWIS